MTLLVATLDAAGLRHIIARRGAPTACGLRLEGRQAPPQPWARGALCRECVERWEADTPRDSQASQEAPGRAEEYAVG